MHLAKTVKLKPSILAAGAVLGFTAFASPLAHAAPSATAVGVSGWNYSVGRDGQWRRDIADPSQHSPADGDVLGWTYGPLSGGTSPTPAASANYESLCPEQTRAASAGPRVRIAIVVDSSRAAEPAEEPVSVSCITVSRGTHANDALSQAGNALRFDGSLLCAVNNIPAEGCLDAGISAGGSSSSTPRPSSTDISTDSSTTQPSPRPSSSSGSSAQPTTDTRSQPNALTQTPRAWVLSGGLLLLAIGLLAASSRKLPARRSR